MMLPGRAFVTTFHNSETEILRPLIMRHLLSCIIERISNLDITKGQNASWFMEYREFPYPEKGLAPTKMVP